jgi:hypothetical protein
MLASCKGMQDGVLAAASYGAMSAVVQLCMLVWSVPCLAAMKYIGM